MMPIDLTALPVVGAVVIFAVAGLAVWSAGTRLGEVVNGIAHKAGLGQAFSGMLLLGGITSLPELATVATASVAGNPALAVNNLLGSAAINVMLLAAADVVFGREALTSAAAQPATLMQGVLSMMLLAAVATVVTTGDVAVAGVGIGATALAVACIAAIRLSAKYEASDRWRVVEPPGERRSDTAQQDAEERRHSLGRLILTAGLLGAIILVAGFFLSLSADTIARQTGYSSGMIGFVFVAFATSLPELSSITGAARARRYEMAVGDIFGTNLFNIGLLLLADAVYSGEPVLELAGPFEAIGALLAMLLTGVFVVGLLERKNRTFLRMGYDAVIAIPLFAAGLLLMSRFVP